MLIYFKYTLVPGTRYIPCALDVRIPRRLLVANLPLWGRGKPPGTHEYFRLFLASTRVYILIEHLGNRVPGRCFCQEKALGQQSKFSFEMDFLEVLYEILPTGRDYLNCETEMGFLDIFWHKILQGT